MAGGVEIVIKPIHLERLAYSLVIIVLAVLLILRWNGGSCIVPGNETTGAVLTGAGLNETNQTANASQEEDLCANNIRDQDETDVDCGGSICEPCPEFKNCNVDSDCESGYCHMGIKCMKPTCDDGIKNQDETNVDCGGVCGGYWWSSDSSCHDKEEPSGKLTVNLSADVGESELSGNALINSITLSIDNGLPKTLFLTAYVYALNPQGVSIFINQAGNDIAITTLELEGIPTGDKLTKTIDFSENTYRILKQTSPEDEYQILVELRDQNNDLVKKITWTNK